MIENYVAEHPQRACAVASLGQRRYLSVLKMCDAVIGNSSSGLTEAPSFGVPTVNLGDRQKGRLRASSVLDCEETCEAIQETLTKALSPEFREKAAQTTNPYGQGGASKKIKEILKSAPLEGLLEKAFFDISFGVE
jgi:UDP-N-acetylglucosamine 2-epimerase